VRVILSPPSLTLTLSSKWRGNSHQARGDCHASPTITENEGSQLKRKGSLHASMIHDYHDPSYLKRGTSRSLVMTWESRERKSPSPKSSPIKGEEDHPSVSQFKTFLIISVRLSLVTRSVSTSGWRLISSAKG
jgi:hypothetical protein